MKKAAILSITAFYLLLTTGMFVCIVHCAAETLVKSPDAAMSMAAMHHHYKGCASSKDCDCAKKHGSFVIKENIKPGSDLLFAQTAVILPHAELAKFLVSEVATANNVWHYSNAPPWRSGRSIIIQHRSLLI
jgi:hypothetical protein